MARPTSRHLNQRLPVTIKWYRGATQPPLNTEELTLWEDTADDTAKILMKRSNRVFAFTSSEVATSTSPVPTTRTITAGAGLTGGGDLSANRTLALDVTYSPTWTGTHVFNGTTTLNAATAITQVTGVGVWTLRSNAGDPLAVPNYAFRFDRAGVASLGHSTWTSGATTLMTLSTGGTLNLQTGLTVNSVNVALRSGALTNGQLVKANASGQLLSAGVGGAYTPTNVTTDRSFDCNATSVDELADVLATLIADLQTIGAIT